jgi:hypothetical protein
MAGHMISRKERDNDKHEEIIDRVVLAMTPTGLAHDAKTNRLFIGCRDEPKMVVMDAATGKVINSFLSNQL